MSNETNERADALSHVTRLSKLSKEHKPLAEANLETNKDEDKVEEQLDEEERHEQEANVLAGNMSTEVANGHPIINTGMDVPRFIVSDRDDGDPAITFRALVLGTAFTAFACVINMLYMFKPIEGGMEVSNVFLLLVIYLFGLAWARYTPEPARFKNPKVQAILRFVNSGQPFGIKEHVIATLTASSSYNGKSAIEIYAIERLYYNHTVSGTTAVLGTFSIATIGFCLAGLLRPITVYPSAMVYWQNVPLVVLYQRLHFDDVADRVQRLVTFAKVFTGMLIFETIPAYIMPWWNGVSIVCLATQGAKESSRKVITTIFGGASSNEGIGLLNFSFDWQYIQSRTMSLPLKQQANSWIGLVVWAIAMPCLYYANVWGARDLPFMSTSLFGADGKKFSAVKVFGTGVPILDVNKLKETGLPRITATTAWGFFTANMAIGALIMHVVIFYSRDMYRVVQHVRAGTLRDPHYEAMQKYKEVPRWWYLFLFFLGILAGIIVVTKDDTTTLLVWGFLVALLLGCVIAPISCTLYALFGTGIATNQLSKMLGGALHPGRPLANLYFAAWSHQVIALCVDLSQYLKVGQYIKISHRAMFATQLYGTLLGACINYFVMTSIVTNQREILLDPIGDHGGFRIALSFTFRSRLTFVQSGRVRKFLASTRPLSPGPWQSRASLPR